MKLWTIFWAYWKWFCTALVTSAVILVIIAALLGGYEKPVSDTKSLIDACIDRGGAWDEGENVCKSAA